MSNFNSIYSKLPLLFYYYLLEVEVFKTPPNFSTASTAALEAPVTKIFNFDVAVPLAKTLTPSSLRRTIPVSSNKSSLISLEASNFLESINF